MASGDWRIYLDPDKDMRFDLFKNDGLLSDVSIAVSYAAGTLWVASYLGMSRYDGRDWTTWVEGDAGLASSFVNGIRAHGPECWSCTDKGLSQSVGDRWVTYRRAGAGGSVIATPAGGAPAATYATATALPDDFVWSIDFDGRDVWVGHRPRPGPRFRNGPAPAETAEGGRP